MASAGAILDKILELEVPGVVVAEYVWIDGTMMQTRSKSKTLTGIHVPGWQLKVEDLPNWNFDGSSTGQAPGEDSEVILVPRAIFKDPFRLGPNILVMCDCQDPQGNALPSNTRDAAAAVFADPKAAAEEPWFGLEQEYALLDKDTGWPLGWPAKGFPGPQGPYYCSAGADKVVGRTLVDVHYKACLYAGIQMSGTNGEVMPAQWEYQVGPCTGIAAGDQLWMSRYILDRVGELAGVVITLDPKPMPGDWNGSGCHANFSTKTMRADGGYEAIKAACAALEKTHLVHIAAYGEGNERRLTGKHETADIHTFSWGVANRGASIRVGRETEANGKGYLEDRRPASNCDPYVVTSLLVKTTVL